MKILLTGAVVSNGGDRAITEAELLLIRDALPNATVELSDNRPEIARVLMTGITVVGPLFERVNVPSLTGRWGNVAKRLSYWRMIYAAKMLAAHCRWGSKLLTNDEEFQSLIYVKSFSAVLLMGGTNLTETYWLMPKLFEAELAHALGVPIVLMTQSLGPFKQSFNVAAINRVSRFARLIILRDQESLENLKAIGADTATCIIQPDIVFAMATPAAISSLRLRTAASAGASIGISVRDLTNFSVALRMNPEAFSIAVAQFVTEVVVERGARVVFLSTCQGVDGYWTDDSRVASEIVSQLPSNVVDSVALDSSFHSTAELMALYADLDVIVATRLHACILALNAGTLVLPVAYEFKTRTVFRQLGAPEIVVDAQDVTLETLISALDLVLGPEQVNLRSRLADGLAQACHSASNAGRLAARALDLG